MATHLPWIGIRCFAFVRLQIRTQSWRKSYTAFGHPTQVDTSWSQVICICLKFTTFFAYESTCESVWPPGHRKSVRKFWFCKLASACESVWPGLKCIAISVFKITASFVVVSSHEDIFVSRNFASSYGPEYVSSFCLFLLARQVLTLLVLTFFNTYALLLYPRGKFCDCQLL